MSRLQCSDPNETGSTDHLAQKIRKSARRFSTRGVVFARTSTAYKAESPSSFGLLKPERLTKDDVLFPGGAPSRHRCSRMDLLAAPRAPPQAVPKVKPTPYSPLFFLFLYFRFCFFLHLELIYFLYKTKQNWKCLVLLHSGIFSPVKLKGKGLLFELIFSFFCVSLSFELSRRKDSGLKKNEELFVLSLSAL